MRIENGTGFGIENRIAIRIQNGTNRYPERGRARNGEGEREEHYAEEGAANEEASEEEDGGPLRLHHEVVVKEELPDPPYAAAPSPQRRRRPAARRSRPARPHLTSETSPVLDRNLVRAIRSVTRAELRRGGACGRDECDVFGEYIANALRKHDERTRAMIKHAIGNILFEQEMKQYAVATAPPRNPLLLDVERARSRPFADRSP
ncbi:hypothetical protein EVAR_86966_1 [Eumeta japonica]|uniref:BESS domain-containing protein n=1 Tax=Eumeta variegata TaxID=151549 RepID=A0A4C1W6S3_EUMVA|nr:hypothetical protein EVAR_86966_1 [Eumeta japonica]